MLQYNIFIVIDFYDQNDNPLTSLAINQTHYKNKDQFTVNKQGALFRKLV